LQKEEKMVGGQKRRVVSTFYNRIDAEHALNELNSAGFRKAEISVSANTERDDQLDGPCTHCNIEDKPEERTATCGTITGSMLGAIGGYLVGLGLLAVPGVGPLVAVGASGTAVITTLAGVGIGIASCSLIEALANLGISSNREAEYLVMVDGTDDEVRQAESIIKQVSANHLHPV